MEALKGPGLWPMRKFAESCWRVDMPVPEMCR